MGRFLISLSVLLILTAIGIGIYTAYYDSPRRQIPIVFAQKPMLDSIWHRYKQNYLEPGSFRTLDRQRNDITTSEGQSYTMLRAVWSDDREVFDGAWKWTKDVLQRNEDKLFAWKFGKRKDDTYGILFGEGGYNTASDADSDTALALIFAFARWRNTQYLTEAKLILKDIWHHEVVFTSSGRPIVAATNLEKSFNKQEVIVNPSYLAPYAYRIFAKVDPQTPWNRLARSSYWLLEKASKSNLDKPSSVNLPPDWITLNLKTEQVTVALPDGLTTNYGYDAMRVTWRLGVDWAWYQEPRAKAQLEKFAFLGQQWAEKKKLNAVYTHDGLPAADWESVAAYANNLPYFALTNPQFAGEIYDTRLKILYNPDTDSWKEQLSYYDDNWAWFGMALYNGLLPNLTDGIENFPNS